MYAMAYTESVLVGGTKHGQSKDIKKAKKLLEEVKGNSFTPT